MHPKICQYDGCEEPANGEHSFCFWHDPQVDKSGDDVRKRLETRARSGQPMIGFHLRRANLAHVNLVNPSGEPFLLIHSDLSRANLSHAHLYQLDLSGSSLLKANLSNASLHQANLHGCNLLGANLKDAAIENVIWGQELLQEQLARDEPEQAELHYAEAEEVARNIRRNSQELGLNMEAGKYYYKERVFQRYQMPKYSTDRLWSWLVDKISGYGEMPHRVVLFSGTLVFLCALVYWMLGVSEGGTILRYDPHAHWLRNLHTLAVCIYYSVTTFTTLGFGDISPVDNVPRLVSAMEAFIGSFSMALFVVLFVRRTNR